MASQQEEVEDSRAEGARDFLGRQKEMLESGFSFSGFERDGLFLNRQDGSFVNISGVSGADSVSDGRGAVYADLDNDGDTDIFLRAMHGPAHFLYENRMGQENGFLRIALEGRASGRDAFGATVTVVTGDSRQSKVKSGGSGFLSQSDPRLLFGLGQAAAVESILVTWPSGLSQRFAGAPAGASLLLVEGEDAAIEINDRAFNLPLPRDAEDELESRLNFARGTNMQDVPLLSLAGETVRLSSILRPGSRTLVNFWATWCMPCAREMPELQALWENSEGSLNVVGISLDLPEHRSRINGFLQKVGVTYPVYASDPETWETLFRSGDIPVPLSVLVDGDGNIEALFSGWSRTTRHRLLAIIDNTPAAGH